MELSATWTDPQRGEYRWVVKETEGRWWLTAEPCGAARLKIVGPDRNDLQIALNLRPGITRARAHKLAEMMNLRIASIELF
jgi:hypothetical protein